jgi:iron complex outermembrane recepter protein
VKKARISKFKYTVAPLALGLSILSTAAMAQDAADEGAEEASTEKPIVVTGSILKRADTNTPSPVTVVTAEELDKKGISTVQDAIQQIASNNGPALTNSFTANGAFAAGASAVSLRGLSTNSTLVLFDGLRAAYYPLADDGSRNFVDLNTIPDDIVERVEVLRDGASSAYGADAIAGVVNIITKRQFVGVGGRAEAGITSRGDGTQYRLNLTAGVGDLETNGINAYISGFYLESEGLKNRQRGFPFNTDDERNVCNGSSCGPDNRQNGLVETAPGSGVFTYGGLDTAANFMVRPYNATNTAAIAGGAYQNLNAQCPGGGQPYALSAAEIAANPIAPTTVCQYDYTNLYGTISPDIQRFGASARVTAKLSDSIEAYGEFNFMQSKVGYTGFPATVRGTANTGILFRQFSTSTAAGPTNAPGSGILALPVYVCPLNGQSAVMVNGVPQAPGGCTAATPGARLNPNNPFAAAGNTARILGRDMTQVTDNQTRNRAFRFAFGVNGPITDNIDFDVSGTAMHVDLRRRTDGYVYIQHLLDVIADGSYNFANPAASSQATLDYLTPVNITNASSDQYQIQAVVSSKLMDLPGGPLQLAVGGSVRYEAVDAPSANDDTNGPTQRYFTLNAFGTKGSRTITSVFGELNAPIVEMVEANLSGRYDSYSSGQSAFSPKFGLKFTPIQQLTFRGTYSRGFRIPSFGEANALPTTGFVSNNVSLFNNTYLAQYGCSTTTFASCPAYIRAGSYGQTTLASPDLEPEKSRSFTGGVSFDPVSNVRLTIDYYDIKKTNVITQPSNAPALLAYYSGQPIPAGYTVIADAPDPNFPLATPRVAFVASQLINANEQRAKGIDFTVDASFDITDNIKWSTSAEASYILRLSQIADGVVERYDGTLGNFNLTAGSGTPKWHGSWLNTLDFGDFELNGTVNYFGGYDLSAQDQGTGYKDCGLDPGYSPSGCKVKAYMTFDLNAQVKVGEKFTLYATMINAFDKAPRIDVVTYGAHLYNPVQGGTGIYGRQFRAGVKFGF